MSDRYNSKIAGLIGKLNGCSSNYAVTISKSCTLYSVPKSMVCDEWRRHEDKHKEQFAIRGWWHMITAYFIRIKNEGYYNNQFKIDAREAEKGE